MKRVVIDCEKNDEVDIRCGGPQYLGFDFVVDDSENDKELYDFLKVKLKENGHSCLGIKIYDIPEYKIWTREEMEKCIKETEF